MTTANVSQAARPQSETGEISAEGQGREGIEHGAFSAERGLLYEASKKRRSKAIYPALALTLNCGLPAGPYFNAVGCCQFAAGGRHLLRSFEPTKRTGGLEAASTALLSVTPVGLERCRLSG